MKKIIVMAAFSILAAGAFAQNAEAPLNKNSNNTVSTTTPAIAAKLSTNSQVVNGGPAYIPVTTLNNAVTSMLQPTTTLGFYNGGKTIIGGTAYIPVTTITNSFIATTQPTAPVIANNEIGIPAINPSTATPANAINTSGKGIIIGGPAYIPVATGSVTSMLQPTAPAVNGSGSKTIIGLSANPSITTIAKPAATIAAGGHAKTTSIKTEVKALLAEIMGIKADIKNLKTLIKERKADIKDGNKAGATALTKEIQKDKAAIRADRKTLRADFKALRHNLRAAGIVLHHQHHVFHHKAPKAVAHKITHK